MKAPLYEPKDVPVGVRLVSHRDPEMFGTVTEHFEVRGLPVAKIEWDNGSVSFPWIHDMTNLKAPSCRDLPVSILCLSRRHEERPPGLCPGPRLFRGHTDTPYPHFIGTF
jgi:hypothetical protein